MSIALENRDIEGPGDTTSNEKEFHRAQELADQWLKLPSQFPALWESLRRYIDNDERSALLAMANASPGTVEDREARQRYHGIVCLRKWIKSMQNNVSNVDQILSEHER